MKLNDETRTILKKEYQWLPELLHEDVYEFYVQVIDWQTLKLTPWGEHIGSNQHWFVPFKSIHKLLLIDGKGEVLGKVGVRRRAYAFPCFTWRWPFLLGWSVKYDEEDFCETVENALKRIPGAERTRYILHVANWVAILHRLPKRCHTSLAKYLEEKKGQELRSLHELTE